MSWKKPLRESQFSLPILIPGLTHFQGSCIEKGREISFELQGYMDPIELRWKATVVDIATGIDAGYTGCLSKDGAMEHAVDELFQKIEQNGSPAEAKPLHISSTVPTHASPPPYQVLAGPQLPDLMNEVANCIPDLWREVGVQLGVPVHMLDSFWRQRSNNNMDCFKDVFTYWKDKCTKSYSWLTMIQVLETPAVGQVELAQNIKANFVKKQ